MERDELLKLVERWEKIANDDADVMRSMGILWCAQELCVAICEHDAKQDPSLIM